MKEFTKKCDIPENKEEELIPNYETVKKVVRRRKLLKFAQKILKELDDDF